jgi:hypothetical protein
MDFKFTSLAIRMSLVLLCLYAMDVSFLQVQALIAIAPRGLRIARQRTLAGVLIPTAAPPLFVSIARRRIGCTIRPTKNECILMTLQEDNENRDDAKVETTTATESSSDFSNLSPTEFILATEKMDPATRAVVIAAQKKRHLDQGNSNTVESFPIDLPSPILLSTSMILAIASTGTLLQ